MAEELLRDHGIHLKSYAPGRHYSTCPECSRHRKKKKARCLSIKIDARGACWHCIHCHWKGPEKGSDRELPYHVYCHPDTGEPLFRKVRNVPGREPRFWLERYDGEGGWIKGVNDDDGNPLVDTSILYRADEVQEAKDEGEKIAACEGESDCDSLWELGIPATTSAHGAAPTRDNHGNPLVPYKPKWYRKHSEHLRGAKIVVFNDNDEPGYKHAETTCKLSHNVAESVQRLDLKPHWPEIPKGGDLRAWLSTIGGTREEKRERVLALMAAAPLWDGDGGRGEDEDEDADEDEQTDVAPAFSEEAIAIDFANRHAGDLRYVAQWNRWYYWDRVRWREDETRKVYTIARGLCRELALTANKPSESKRIASAKTRAAVVSLAGEDRRLAATVDQWDADQWSLNTPGGVVDLRTGEMREHRPDDYMTKCTAVAPDKNCPIPSWMKFMGEVTCGDEQLQEYLQRVAGYFLTGDTSEQELYFFYGDGNNGKGTWTRTISGVLHDYHEQSSIETFTISPSERHPTELAKLRGARLVTASETEEGRRWAEARIKEMTGGDPIDARFMRQDFFTYLPRFKLLFSGNHMPSLRTVNKAITRRFNRIPFKMSIPDDQVDKHLEEKKLRAEWPGILAWMVEGCLMWQRDGLKPPQAVTDATEQYLEAQDPIGEWLQECCDLGPGHWEGTRTLYGSWKPWAEERGEWIGSEKQFAGKLEDRGGLVRQKNPDRTQRGFRGLRLKRASVTVPEAVCRWIGECCDVDDDFWTDSITISMSWKAFAKEHGHTIALIAFEQALRDRNFQVCDTDEGPGWQGLRIKKTNGSAAAGSGAHDADDDERPTDDSPFLN
jgi:putative DNA primase/helicase